MNKNYSFNLDTSWIDNIKINLSAIERRTTTLIKRRTVKKRDKKNKISKKKFKKIKKNVGH